MNRVLPPDAFEYYVALGVERTHQKVADHFGVTRRAVAKCASREDWTGRLKDIEANVLKQTTQRMTDTMVEVRERHLKILRAMNAKALTALQQYPLNSAMEAVRVLELVIKLERLILGEANERTEVGVQETTRKELERWLTSASTN